MSGANPRRALGACGRETVGLLLPTLSRDILKMVIDFSLYRAHNVDVFFLSRRLPANGIYQYPDMMVEHIKVGGHPKSS
jgi:hypothetical protein